MADTERLLYKDDVEFCARLVAIVEEIDEETDRCRREMHRLAGNRAEAIHGIYELVGAVRTAKLLGVNRQAVYRAVGRHG
jgi:hypothetical protein